MNNVPAACHYCGPTTKELRPYGPKGAWVCFRCAMKPEHERETNSNFHAQLDAAGPVAIIGEDTGPRPFKHEKPS